MIARAAGLVLLAIVRVADAEACAVAPPTGQPAPYQAAVYEAAIAGFSHTDVTLPAKSEGFNRTVSIDGLCDNGVTTSSSFTCQSGGGEFHAGLLVGAAPVTLNFGSASCQMTGISVYKTGETTGFEAEMRLQFEGCKGLNAVDNAAVIVGIRKDPVEDLNLLAWSKQVCKTVTTTTVAPAQVSQETDAFVAEVGAGHCEGAERRRIENVTSEKQCKIQCMGSATSAHVLGQVGCTGFAFNAAAAGANCITYNGAVTQATANAGWKCFNMSLSSSSISKSTVAPPVVAQELPQELYIEQALGKSAMAYMHEISPPKDSPACFKPMWWFKLEDRDGRPISVAVKDADWDKFMSDPSIPVAEKTSSSVRAPMVLDRVLFDTCTKSDGWGAATCYVPPPVKTQCRSEEETGAVVSGVFTAVFTWLMVGIVFKVCSLSKKSSVKGEYTKLDGPQEGPEPPVCGASVVAFLTLVAAGAAFGICFFAEKFLTIMLRSAECYDEDEFMVIMLAVVISTALTIMLVLWYMAQFRHPHTLVANVGAPVKKAAESGTNLMLIDVEDGKTIGSALDSIQMTQQGGQVTGFRSLNSPGGTPNASYMSNGGPVMTTQPNGTRM